MKLSIIIVSWNVKDLLGKCLESILRHSHGLEYEIIVVDNASADGTLEISKSQFPNSNIKFIKNDTNLGFAKANNQGIREAKGEYVLLLNPDTEFIEDVLSKCVAQMEQVEKIGVLGCQLLNSDMTIQPSVRRFPRVQDIIIILLKLHKLFPSLLNRYLAKDFDYDHPLTPSSLEEGESKEVDQVMGAFFLVRREVFDKIGLLDEKYFIWFEEVDFCRRLRNNGWKVVYYPYARIIHHRGQSFAQKSSLKKQMWFFKSAFRYFLKD